MASKLIDYISKQKVVLFIKAVAKKIVIPGFDGFPIYDVAAFFIKGITKGSINTRASSLSFTFFLALFPAIIFLFTLIPYVPIRNFQDTLLLTLKDVFPEHAFAAAKSTLEDIVKRQHGGLLSVGCILALYFATNGINGIILAFNNTYHTIETRTPFAQRMVSIGLVIVLTLMIILSVSLITFGSAALKYLLLIKFFKSALVFWLMVVLKWVIICATLFVSISILYYYGPAKKERYRFISAGSSLATILFISASLIFNYYVNHFAKYNLLYGSIGTLIVVLIWIYFNAIIILVGFELNASIISAKRKLKEEEEKRKQSEKKKNILRL